MSMVPMRVLRFARSDDKSSFVLLQVRQKGSKSLDLKLVGTEGEVPYATLCKSSHHPPPALQSTDPLKHDRAASLRVKNCPASESEWLAILESLFKQEPLPGINVSATVQSDSSISITVRKLIQGITQRLGAIVLNHSPDENIELFEWCGMAVQAAEASNEAVVESNAKSQSLEATVTQLKSQLDELIRAKEEDEATLLHKFRDLLNEKKVKIREQQKVLAASGSFDSSRPGSSSQPAQQAQISKAPAIPTRQAGKSRGTKRKAPASKRVEESEDEDVEAMEVDEIKREEQETDRGSATEDTASIASNDDEEEIQVDSSRKGKASSPAPEDRNETTRKQGTEQPPPPRSLPFNKKKEAKPAPAPTPAAGGSETDSDDEL